MIKEVDQYINTLFEGFNPKQNKVLAGRFGLKNGKKATLQEIGDELGVTRERVRQIEEDGLKKMRSRSKDELKPLYDFAKTYLASSGGVKRDDYFIGDIARHLYPDSKVKYVDQKIRFLLLVVGDPNYQKETDDFSGYWYSDDNSKKNFLEFVKNTTRLLKNSEGSKERKNYLFECNDFNECHYLSIPKYFGVNVFGDFGLAEWPEISPRTIRDKIYMVLRKHGKPLHFEDIAKHITKLGLDDKLAHVQTVHNELIKDERCVLVGRGIYALREHGYEPGTVKEVITKILKRQGPLVSGDVVMAVNRERLLKENTILLTLQNRRHFRRMEDGRYHLKEA